MLHIIFAQWLRWGAAWHGSPFTPASGQVLDTFQLLANSNILFTASWPWVVKSFCPLPSKSPHRPQTFPCQQGVNHFFNEDVLYSCIITTKRKLLRCRNNCWYSHYTLAAGWCGQMFCDPISLLDRWRNLSPGRGQLFLFCNRSKGRVPGPLLRIYPSIVSLPFSNNREICVSVLQCT